MKFSLEKKSRASASLVPLAFFTTMILVLGVGVVLFIMNDISRSDQVTVKEGETSKQIVVVAGDQSVGNEYFSFSAGTGWRSIDKFSLEGKRYRFSQFDGDHVKRHLTVYINDSTEREVDHIVAVVKQGDGLSVEAPASAHCSGQDKQDVKTSKRIVDLNGVRFLCNVDGHLYSAAAGLVDGGIKIPAVRPSDGSKITYTLFYEDVTFSPDPSIFENMIESFQFK